LAAARRGARDHIGAAGQMRPRYRGSQELFFSPVLPRHPKHRCRLHRTISVSRSNACKRPKGSHSRDKRATRMQQLVESSTFTKCTDRSISRASWELMINTDFVGLAFARQDRKRQNIPEWQRDNSPAPLKSAPGHPQPRRATDGLSVCWHEIDDQPGTMTASSCGRCRQQMIARSACFSDLGWRRHTRMPSSGCAQPHRLWQLHRPSSASKH
jgi:hypothetical protein